ncbi:hypothetical protein BDW22DRAFT_1343607 [Trametopsis cervina]|nr:hypothetical protein BDW22DRAFT_1343607 [Trametopsis cervina]
MSRCSSFPGTKAESSTLSLRYAGSPNILLHSYAAFKSSHTKKHDQEPDSLFLRTSVPAQPATVVEERHWHFTWRKTNTRQPYFGIKLANCTEVRASRSVECNTSKWYPNCMIDRIEEQFSPVAFRSSVQVHVQYGVGKVIHPSGGFLFVSRVEGGKLILNGIDRFLPPPPLSAQPGSCFSWGHRLMLVNQKATPRALHSRALFSPVVYAESAGSGRPYRLRNALSTKVRSVDDLPGIHTYNVQSRNTITRGPSQACAAQGLDKAFPTTSQLKG